MDYNILSYFFKYYVYDNPKTDIFFLQIPRLCREIMNDTTIQKLAILEPFRNKASTLKDLTFSKRVYVYHETPVDIVALKSIEDILKEKNLFPEFRGPNYPFFEQHKKDTMAGYMWLNSPPP